MLMLSSLTWKEITWLWWMHSINTKDKTWMLTGVFRISSITDIWNRLMMSEINSRSYCKRWAYLSRMTFLSSLIQSASRSAYWQDTSPKCQFCKKTTFTWQVNLFIIFLVKDSQVVTIHPSSVLNYRPEFVLYNDLVLTKKNYMRTVMSVKPEWLFEIAPLYYRPESIKNIETRKAMQKV